MELKFKSRLDSLFPKVFPVARLLQKDLLTRRGANGIDLSNFDNATSDLDQRIFIEPKLKSGESTLNFGEDLSKVYEVRHSEIEGSILNYQLSKTSFSHVILKDKKLLLLLSTLDFIFRMELLKTSLGTKKLFKDPNDYWSNFNNNVIEPLKQESLSLMHEFKNADKNFLDHLRPLISEAKLASWKWINQICDVGAKYTIGSSRGNPQLIQELRAVNENKATDIKWSEYLKPLHSAA